MAFPNCRVVNLIGAPGVGKSLIAFLIFAELKIRGKTVEYVPEYAKKLVWASKFDVLNEQYFVSRKQMESLRNVYGKVEYVVTDGSLVHGLYYNRHNPNNNSNVQMTEDKILEDIASFHNVNIHLQRGEYKYECEGRQQTEQEARVIDTQMQTLLDNFGIDYKSFQSDVQNIKAMVDFILTS